MECRVLHILYSLNVGGAETFIMNLYRNIDRDKFQFDFLVHKEDFYDEEVKRLGGKIYYLKGYVSDVGVFKYKQHLMEFFKSNLASQYSIVHVHVNQTSGLIIPIIKKTTEAICIAHSHDLKNYNSCIISLYKKMLQFKLNKYVDYRIACSRSSGLWLYRKHPFTVIHNGISCDKFHFSLEDRKVIRKKQNIEEKEILLGCVGRFEDVKNQSFLVELFDKELKSGDYKMILIGDGSKKENISEMISKLNLNNKIKIISSVSNIENYYCAMDALLLPSISEAFGIVAVEAQANGLPVLASTGVAKEAKVSDQMMFLNLDYKTWAVKIKSLTLEIERSKALIDSNLI